MAGKDDKRDQKDELPKLEDWKAPWEVKKSEDGSDVDVPEEEQEIDRPKLKKYLYGLLSDKVRSRKSLEETTARAEALEQQITEATDPDKVKKLQDDLAAAQKERDEAKGDITVLRYEVALEKGLTKKQAKRLVGNTKEELEADADDLLEEFGSHGETDGEGGEPRLSPRTAPRRQYSNAGDPEPEGEPKKKEPSPEEVALKWAQSR